MGTFLYISPAEMWSLQGASTASSIDADYDEAWLTDTRAGRPVRTTGTSLSSTTNSSSGEVGLVALANVKLSVSASVGGDVTATIPAPTIPSNGIPLNPFVSVTPVTASRITLDITGNDTDVVIGELIYGKARELFPGPPPNTQARGYDDYALPQTAEFGSVPPYDRGLERRTFSFTQIYFEDAVALLIDAQRAQRGGSLPMGIVPDSAVNDFWVVYLQPLRTKKIAVATYSVDLSFVEHPRVRW